MVLNLRAECDPERLLELVNGALAAEAGARLRLEHEEHFRPARPEPTHRITLTDSSP